jgi:hypothetical protein
LTNDAWETNETWRFFHFFLEPTVLPEGIPRYKAPRLANAMCPRLLRSRGLNLSRWDRRASRHSAIGCREWAHHIHRLDQIGHPLGHWSSEQYWTQLVPETHAKQVTLSWHWNPTLRLKQHGRPENRPIFFSITILLHIPRERGEPSDSVERGQRAKQDPAKISINKEHTNFIRISKWCPNFHPKEKAQTQIQLV